MKNIPTIESMKVIISEQRKIIIIYIINKRLPSNKEKQPQYAIILNFGSSYS